MPSDELVSVPFFARMGHNVMVFWLVIKLLLIILILFSCHANLLLRNFYYIAETVMMFLRLLRIARIVHLYLNWLMEERVRH